MCGIYGYIGSGDAGALCIEGLRRLEYRGYDSSGIAGVHEGKLHGCKEVGNVQVLENAWQGCQVRLSLAIAHTRWATHGIPSKHNAHPQFDTAESIAVVHNGVIENYKSLRTMLEEKGVQFSSDTDTEVVAQLVAHFYKGNFLTAVQESLALMHGLWGLALIHQNHPEEIIVACKENPVAIGVHPSLLQSFISSDPNAFPSKELDVIFLHSNEVAVVRPGKVCVFNGIDSSVSKTVHKLDLEDAEVSKLGYAHYMLKEIFDQPDAMRQAMHGRLVQEFGITEFEGLTLTRAELSAVKRIVILACGTSWHAGCIAAGMLEDMARIPTQAEIASEFRYRNPIISEGTLVIAISQSGETLDTMCAVREVKAKGAKVLGICNVKHSTLSREADACIFLKAGVEVSVCSTKAFTSQLVVLSLFTLLMARLRHMEKQEGQKFLVALQNIPKIAEQVLAKHAEIVRLAQLYTHYESFFFLGRHYMFTTALESALKLKEISYLHAYGVPAGEMKHGPIALIGPELAVIGMCGNVRTQEKMVSSLMEVKARGAPLLVFVPEGSTQFSHIADHVLELPEVCDELMAVPYAIAGQLFAYEIAKIRGTSIDQPRNLAKSVTVE